MANTEGLGFSGPIRQWLSGVVKGEEKVLGVLGWKQRTKEQTPHKTNNYKSHPIYYANLTTAMYLFLPLTTYVCTFG